MNMSASAIDQNDLKNISVSAQIQDGASPSFHQKNNDTINNICTTTILSQIQKIPRAGVVSFPDNSIFITGGCAS